MREFDGGAAKELVEITDKTMTNNMGNILRYEQQVVNLCNVLSKAMVFNSLTVVNITLSVVDVVLFEEIGSIILNNYYNILSNNNNNR